MVLEMVATVSPGLQLAADEQAAFCDFGGFFAMELDCPVSTVRMFGSVFPDRIHGSNVWLGDTGAMIHGVPSGEHVYNRR